MRAFGAVEVAALGLAVGRRGAEGAPRLGMLLTLLGVRAFMCGALDGCVGSNCFEPEFAREPAAVRIWCREFGEEAILCALLCTY